jgi:hypothetical protein
LLNQEIQWNNTHHLALDTKTSSARASASGRATVVLTAMVAALGGLLFRI